MLRYDRHTKPGLVAFYDIRPGNGASLFLQPRTVTILALVDPGVGVGNRNNRGDTPSPFPLPPLISSPFPSHPSLRSRPLKAS